MGRILDTKNSFDNRNRNISEGRMMPNVPLLGEGTLTKYGITGTTINPNTLYTVGSFLMPSGRVFDLKSMTIICDREAVILIRIVLPSAYVDGTVSQGSVLGVYEQHWVIFKEAGTQILSFQDKYIPENAQIIILYWRSGSTEPYVNATLNGIDYTADDNFGASKVLTVVADSFGHTGSGSIYGSQYFPFVLRDNMIANNQDVRLVNKSFGSAVMNSAANIIRQGWIDFPSDYVVISLGYNDASNSAGAWASARVKFKDDLNEIIKRVKLNSLRYKSDTRILICKPYVPISSDTNRNANIVDVRLAIQEVKDSLYSTDTKVAIGDFTGVYSNSSGNFMPDLVHVTPANQLLLGNKVWADMVNSSGFLK